MFIINWISVTPMSCIVQHSSFGHWWPEREVFTVQCMSVLSIRLGTIFGTGLDRKWQNPHHYFSRRHRYKQTTADTNLFTFNFMSVTACTCKIAQLLQLFPKELPFSENNLQLSVLESWYVLYISKNNLCKSLKITKYLGAPKQQTELKEKM